MRYFTKSKIFLYFCLSFIAGIGIASFFTIDKLSLLAVLILPIIAISVFWENKKTVALAVCVIFLLAGFYHYQSYAASTDTSKIGIDGIIGDNGQAVTFRGVIVSWPEQRTNSVYYEVAPRDLEIRKEKISSNDKILAVLPLGEQEYQYGDLVEFRGKIKPPSDYGDFSYKKYLANKHIYFLMNYPKTEFLAGDIFCNGAAGKNNIADKNSFECEKYKFFNKLFVLRSEMTAVMAKSMPEPESSISAAILFGNDKSVPKDLIDKFNATGTRHIMAVSGQNISILVLILLNFALAVGSSRRVAFYFALISIIFYILLIGMPASAVRAGIMGLLVLVAERVGRLSVSYRALVFAATGMLFLNPSLLVFDVGFQLSFAATIGIIFIYPVLSQYLGKIPNFLEIRSSLAMTLAALATTLPVSILSFNQFSVISPIANILIVPLVPIVMILGIIIIITGVIIPLLGTVIGWVAWLVLAYEVKTVEFLGSFSFSSFKTPEVNFIYISAYYLVLVVVIIKLKKRLEDPGDNKVIE